VRVPALVLPGSGGLDLDEITARSLCISKTLSSAARTHVGGQSARFPTRQVHQDVFFRCLPKVLAEFPQAYFVCTAMQNQPQAQKWVSEYHLENHVLLLPYLNQQQLWQLFSRSQVYVSLSSHDGTPNTFLEAMACGCFPVVGDIESLREWLENGGTACWLIRAMRMRPLTRSCAPCAIRNYASAPGKATFRF
jgi:glycosyltransferase involved in cell wall biosynthesis